MRARLTAALAAALLLSTAAHADDIAGTPRAIVEGQPIIVDGDTLHIEVPLGRVKVRLGEIMAPDRGKRLYQESGARLSELAGGWVVCRLTGAVSFDRVVAYCEAGGQDLGMSMVRDGFAEQDRRFGGSYLEAELEAREARRGIWAGN